MLSEGNFVVDVFSEVRPMPAVHEGLEDTSDGVALRCCRCACEAVPPVRSTLDSGIELLNCSRL